MTYIPETDGYGKVNKCCTEKNLDFFDGGDGCEWEVWTCLKCKQPYVVPIEIVRYFKDSMIQPIKPKLVKEV
tara:strand:+ start:2632 stop:2847 length:216 start_codon:yes stop_codon:yes gene_type:complete